MHVHAGHAEHDRQAADPAGGKSARGRLALGFALTLAFAAIEALGGWLAGSLALLADSVHMLADSAALLLALLAARIAERPHTPRFTFGYHRTEVLAALANAVLLWLLLLRISWEAVHRLAGLRLMAIDGRLMLLIATIGLGVNLIVLLVLRGRGHEAVEGHHHDADLNLRAAMMHVVGDLLGSGAAIVAAILILLLGWTWADPVASLAVALLIAISAWRILREAAEVLLDVAPSGKDARAIEDALISETGVASVHDLHVWRVTAGRVALSAHVRLREGQEPTKVLHGISRLLAERFGIHHTTIQLEPERGVAGWARLPAHPAQD